MIVILPPKRIDMDNNYYLKRIYIASMMALAAAATANGAIVRGTVTDRSTGEPLIGATVLPEKADAGAVTDIDGIYMLTLPSGRHNLTVRYVGYNDTILGDVKVNRDTVVLNIVLTPDVRSLSEVTVTAVARKDTEVAQIQEQRSSSVVQSGVSSQQVEKTQDKDASEVIRRIPGISIIDEKFVMVRGLSQRYNNVWLNGSAVPSSEADSRAFSFDIIPSSQLDNITIVKSPAPEYPADFTGGFILVNTKQQPLTGGLNIGIGVGLNDRTHFRDFMETDGHSQFPSETLSTYAGFDDRISVTDNSFNNNWRIKSIHPVADLKLNASYTHTWQFDNGVSWGLLSAANFSDTYRTMLDMENSLYGPYDTSNDKDVPLRKAKDNQYTHGTRIGAMLNISFRPGGNSSFFEWKNIFNVIMKDRYSDRWGFNAQSDNINDMEYYYSSRPTFNTQFTGKHTLDNDYIDWSAGYAFARRNMPDRRLIQRTDRTDRTMGIYRISREFTRLDEHIGSVNANYKHTFHFSDVEPILKAGLYGEYRTRTYDTRQFQYGWQPDNVLPDGFMFDTDVQDNVLIDANYGPDRLYLYEEVNYLNNYNGNQSQASGYVSFYIPWHRLSVYAGVRYEYCRQVLKMNTRQYEESLRSTTYNYNDIFPSVNAVYHIDDCNQVRAAYGRSTNRPEFRELSSSVYYDFDLGSSVMGNPDLEAAYIDNFDLRYELYPSKGEQVSLALFYKKFSHPIEWTYTVSGGTDLIYSFVNARGADNYGVELDIRKSLDFIGLKDFSLSFNGALIKSKVRFDEGSNNIDRPMQGQSPYLINTGLFYSNTVYGWNAAILYNRIGKRIIGVGNRYGSASDGSVRNIPNSYEMPRNSLDLSVGKKFGKWNLKLSIRDLLAEKYMFKQIDTVTVGNQEKTIEEVTRSYRPGRNFNLSLSCSF